MPMGFALVVDEEEPVRGAAVRLLEHAGYTARAFAALPEAVLATATERPELLLVSATIAAAHAQGISAIRRTNAEMAVVLTCPQAMECPVHAGLQCLNLDCLRKPLDFVPARFADRIAAARRSIARPQEHIQLVAITNAFGQEQSFAAKSGD